MRNEILENLSFIATIGAAIVTALSLGFGYKQYANTTEAQQNASAVSLYLEYLKFMREVEKDEAVLTVTASAAAASAAAVGASAPIIPNRVTPTIPSAIATAGEAIYLLRRGDKGWELSVVNMIQNNSDRLRSHPWQCSTMHEQFVELLKTHASITCLEDSKR